MGGRHYTRYMGTQPLTNSGKTGGVWKCYKALLFPQIYFFPFSFASLRFFLTIGFGMAPPSDTNYAWRSLTMAARVSLLFTILSTSLSYFADTQCSSISLLVDGMTMNIGSLAAGLDGLVVRLEIRRKRKNRETLPTFFRCTPLSIL
jgi:hypothetical protein